MACWNPRLEVDWMDIRQHINEQLKCLDVRVEVQAAIVAEIQEFFRRRAEVELEYSRSLEKLVKSLTLRHKAEKQKREQWHLFSSNTCWENLLSTTRKESRDRAVLSEIYANALTSRFGQIIEDVERMYKRCRQVGVESHEELLKLLYELHTSMKTYHAYHSEERQMESKIKILESQKSKLEQSVSSEKIQRLKKYNLIVKDLQKRQSKYNDSKLKSLKARNEYLLCLDAANAVVHKYYVDNIPDLIDCMDFGFYTCLARTLKMHVSAEENLQKSKHNSINEMIKAISRLDARVDKQRFLEHNNSVFMVPKKFEFQAHKGDKVSKLCLDNTIREELEQRYKQLKKRLTSLKAENEEVWKTLETAERSLLEMISIKDYDCSSLFADESNDKNGLKQPETLALKLRADRQETEDFYLYKFQKYTLDSNLIARLQAKAEVMRRELADEAVMSASGVSLSLAGSRPHTLPHRTRKKRIGQTLVVGQPMLFGGSLEEYLEATNQEIPLIIRSCIRIINLYGLHHQGVFRVSGSQVEINNLKDAFERGEDPLADMTDPSDINSVAGVLKLYLRELREPLFPVYFFDQLVEISQVEFKSDFINKVRDVVASLPRPVYVVLRYLFAFLNHVSESSDENMMDPHNLATCFGPSLLPIPEDKNQVQNQNLFNELIKNIIIYQEEIFSKDGGMVYEKYISLNVPDENDVGDSPVDQCSDDLDTMDSSEPEILASEDECEILEGVAQQTFCGRTDRELSFKQGDVLQLYSQVSTKWWKGSFNGREGLVPDNFIFLKLKDEDRDKISHDGSERRTSSSSDSLSGYSASPKPSVDIHVPEEGSDTFFPDSLSTLPSSSTSSSGIGSLHSLNCQRRLSLSPSTLRKVQLSASGEFNQPKLVHSSSVGKAMEDLAQDESPVMAKDTSFPEKEENRQVKDFIPNFSSYVESAKGKADELAGISSTDSKETTLSSSKGTPDLVRGLPYSSCRFDLPLNKCSEEKKESSPSHVNSPELTTAERFALSHQGTLKKGGSRPGLKSTVPVKVWTKSENTEESSSSTMFTVVPQTEDQMKPTSEVPLNFKWEVEDKKHSINSSDNQSSEEVHTRAISHTKLLPKVKPPVMKKPTLPSQPLRFPEREYK